MKYKVMITDTCFPDISIENEELRKIDAELVLSKGTDVETLIETGKDCDGVIFDYAEMQDKVLSNLTKCKVAVRYGIGLNTIDLESASRNKIMVANVPDYCLDEVADHTMSLFLTCNRKITQYNNKIRNHVWDVGSGGNIHRIEGQNFCLYGFGNIAQKVAVRAQAFKCNVYAYDPYANDETFERLSVKRVNSLDELASIADVFSIHVPLMQTTEGSVNMNLFKKMKKTVIIINTSRGPIVNEDDLLTALKEKLIMGAGLDVLTNEPPAADSELLSMENVVLTPHVAFYSIEAEEELRRRVVQELIYGLIEGAPHSFINRDAFQSS